MAAVITTSISLLMGLSVVPTLPRGSATASQALLIILSTLVEGSEENHPGSAVRRSNYRAVGRTVLENACRVDLTGASALAVA